MIRYKKAISIAMSMLIMSTVFSTNVFACDGCIINRPIRVQVNNAGEITLPATFSGRNDIIIENGTNADVLTIRINREVPKLDRPFREFTNLTTVDIPENAKLKEIGENAFSGCQNLESITIPNSVTKIGRDAFKGCNGLRNVNIGKQAVKSFRNVFGGLGIKNVSIINGVISISEEAFRDCRTLETVTMSKSVKTIDDRAFMSCTRLKEVTINRDEEDVINQHIPQKVIGEMAFMGCISLNNIEIPSSVTKIKMCAFLGCISLQQIYIPNNVRTIEQYVFFNDKNLRDIRLLNLNILMPDALAGILRAEVHQ